MALTPKNLYHTALTLYDTVYFYDEPVDGGQISLVAGWWDSCLSRGTRSCKFRASSSTGVAVKGIIKSITGGSGIVSERR